MSVCCKHCVVWKPRVTSFNKWKCWWEQICCTRLRCLIENLTSFRSGLVGDSLWKKITKSVKVAESLTSSPLQKLRNVLITSGDFWIRECEGLMYKNHSIENSCKAASRPKLRGKLASLFSWSVRQLSRVRAPKFFGKDLSLFWSIWRFSRQESYSNFGGRDFNRLFESESLIRFFS